MAPKGRGWVFTIHGGHIGLPNEQVSSRVEAALNDHMLQLKAKYQAGKHRSLVMQLEQGGNTGRIHIQGYVWFKHETALTTVKEFLAAGDAPQKAKGSMKKNYEYCTKSDTKLGGYDTVICGNVPTQGQGARKDLDAACELLKAKHGIKAVIEEFPGQYVRFHNGFAKIASHHAAKRVPFMRDMTRVVLHGDPNGGKSYLANTSDIESEIYPLPFLNGKSTWFDNYEGERTLLLEDFRGAIPFGELLRLLDGYKIQVPSKGSFVPAAWTRVIITTNVDPKDWYSATNRRGQEQNRWATEFDDRIGPLERRLDEIWNVKGEWDKGPAWTQVKPVPGLEFLDEPNSLFSSDFSPEALTPTQPCDYDSERPYLRPDVLWHECAYCQSRCGNFYCSAKCEEKQLHDIAETIRLEGDAALPFVVEGNTQ